MSRSVAEFLVEEAKFEEEYQKNFADLIKNNTDNERIERENQIIGDNFNRVEYENKRSILYKYYESLKFDAYRAGLLDKMTFRDFLVLVNLEFYEK